MRWSRIGRECTLAARRASTKAQAPPGTRREWPKRLFHGPAVNFHRGDSVLANGRRALRMAVRNRSESLTWGLLILLLGVLLQLHYLKPDLHILQNLWRFWPVLIIVMGV